VMFGFVNGEYQRVGIAYSTRLRPAIPSPVGLGGDASAAWHDHYLCSIEGRPGPLIVDGNDHCRSLGGNPFRGEPSWSMSGPTRRIRKASTVTTTRPSPSSPSV
jgi:hypothetical protein